MTVVHGHQDHPEPPAGPAPCLRNVVQMSLEDLRSLIMPCLARVREPRPWPAPPMLSARDAQEWLEYVVFETADLLNDRSAEWSWDGIDVPVDMSLSNQLIATCWTDGKSRPLILFVGQPAMLNEDVWSDFKTLRTMPNEKIGRPWTPAESLYSCIDRLCRANKATFFLLTSYSTWMFGILDDYAGACRVTAPLDALTCHGILLAWIYSASGHEGGIMPWDYIHYQLQVELDNLGRSQFYEFERLQYEERRENSVKLADPAAQLQRRRRQEEARHALAREHGQKQKAIVDSLNAHSSKRMMAEMHKLRGMMSPAVSNLAMSSAGTPADYSNLGVDTQSRSSIATPSSFSAPTPAPLRAQSSLGLDPLRFLSTPRAPQRPLPHMDGLPSATPTVPNTATSGTPSAISGASDTSIGSDWPGYEPPQPARPTRQGHAPSSSIDSVENQLAAVSQDDWGSRVRAGFREHVKGMGVWQHEALEPWAGDTGLLAQSPCQILPSDSASQVGGSPASHVVSEVGVSPSTPSQAGFSPASLDVAFLPLPANIDAGWPSRDLSAPRLYPELSPLPMGEQSFAAQMQMDLGGGSWMDGTYNAVGLDGAPCHVGTDSPYNGVGMDGMYDALGMQPMQMQVPAMNQGY
ncbi:hypothetical protein AURDEDRAFT_179424 [Auricularia subglabra TFB-10046 SS5]|nr:hypothetical protein AURDEDRAFT_179424 [Auricularia subglabra TFB-10046 SS5]